MDSVNEIREKSGVDTDLENCSKSELRTLLKENKCHCSTLEVANAKLNNSVTILEQALNEHFEKFQVIEKENLFLRNIIKKASKNWFDRKTKDGLNTKEDSNKGESSTYQKIHSAKSTNYETYESDLKQELKLKNDEITLLDERIDELVKRLKDYENVINDQEIVISGLEKQLDTYFNDNTHLSKQLAAFQKLFSELESINDKNVDEKTIEVDNNDCLTASDTLADDLTLNMSGSVARTYLKLKELIYEKKSLVSEIERLKTLNVELHKRVSTQETRLVRVSDALQTTWFMINKLEEDHEKIHTAATILRYELKEKRCILQKLRKELENSREQWHIIKRINNETEEKWRCLRDEIRERKKMRMFTQNSTCSSITSDEINNLLDANNKLEDGFEPPIDLLVDMGIECGVTQLDDQESITALAILEGRDVREDELGDLETQCSFLYQKLMSSTARALNFASHLSSLQEYSQSEEEYEDDDSETSPDNVLENIRTQDEIFETAEGIFTLEAESYDTAYVSETEGADSAIGMSITNNDVEVFENMEELAEVESEGSCDVAGDDNCDLLSRRLITFLPKKMQILRSEIRKLEEKVVLQKEEKSKLEATLTEVVEFERHRNRELETQLSQLVKCLDQLKVEKSEKATKSEIKKEKEKSLSEVRTKEKLEEELESLKNRYAERGELLDLVSAAISKDVSLNLICDNTTKTVIVAPELHIEENSEIVRSAESLPLAMEETNGGVSESACGDPAESTSYKSEKTIAVSAKFFPHKTEESGENSGTSCKTEDSSEIAAESALQFKSVNSSQSPSAANLISTEFKNVQPEISVVDSIVSKPEISTLSNISESTNVSGDSIHHSTEENVSIKQTTEVKEIPKCCGLEISEHIRENTRTSRSVILRTPGKYVLFFEDIGKHVHEVIWTFWLNK